MALKIKIGKIGLLDMLKFKKMPEVREAHIAQTPADPLPKAYASNAKAALYHPRCQEVILSEIIPNGSDTKTLVFKSASGAPLAPFRAGQYISLGLQIGDVKTTRAYSLSSSPALAFQGIYHIAVKENPGGFVAPYIHENWQVGQKLTISSPEGHLYYEPIRDSKKVIALAGGAGITPFMSMACAIRDGVEDFDLTILFGSRTEDGIVYKKELDEVCAACDKVHVVHVLSDEEKEGYEHGFLTAELIAKYAPQGDYSVFLCGPKAMYAFADAELAKLNLKRRRIRKELAGEYGDPTADTAYPADAAGKTYNITVIVRGESQTIPCRADQTLLDALEKAGIRAPSHCRSGECGWCHSRLVSGDVYIPEDTDGRRAADKKFGWIHPCCSYPITDVTLDVPVIG